MLYQQQRAYLVGDLFNITTGGTIGKGRVDSISAGGLVETVSLFSAGLNYTTGPKSNYNYIRCR
jgi:hypothetical protein